MMVLVAACSPKDDSKPPAGTPANATLTAAQQQHLRFYTVTTSRYHRTIDTTGVVDFDNDQATSVLAPFSGPVTRLLVEPGQKVAKGQPLAIVDSPDYAAAVSAYSKALATARTNRKLADADKDLLQHEGVSEREAQQAQTDAANAEADRDAALKTLASLNVDPRTVKDIEQGRLHARIEGVIRAPIAGTVAERLITPGQLLQAGTTPSFTIADLSRVWVMAQIFGSDLASLQVGDQARIVADTSAHDVTGTVENISALVNPDTRSVQARVAVDNRDQLLKKQAYVHVLIQARRESEGLLVPVSAVLRDDENLPFVYVVQQDGSFARRHVTLGLRAGDRYAIPAGVRTGDRIVVDGALFVQFMQSQ
ncbi:MAG: family efflux transporter, subunit [Alphaproteobacteria bacterium]|nr:family efflux transporter, subunit [Alphaproteobacteria bacterium]